MALGQTATQSGLATMLGQMPERNTLIAQQQKAARALQLQQAVAGLPAGQPATKAQVTQLGGQMAQAAGEQQVSQAQQMMKGAEQVAQVGLQEAQMAGAKELSGLRAATEKKELDQVQRLAALDQKAKQELFDAQMEFRTNAANQTLFTERQLADYAALSANREEAFANWAQKTKQYSERNLAMLKAMERKMMQAMESGYLDEKTKLNQQSKLELQKLIRDTQNRIAKAQAKAANSAMMGNAIGGALGIAGSVAMMTGFVPVGVGLSVAGAGVQAAGQAYGAGEGEKALQE